jgi:pimeloyl-ACP methyl ester carboxylesterase
VTADAPRWFRDAVARAPATGETRVAGTAVRYLSWGEPGTPSVVLLHGGAAHARWWAHLGPLLAAGGRQNVVAPDPSGHGDSGWRERYGLELWAGEALAVAADAGMAEPVLVGHSLGGFVAMAAAAAEGERLAGTVLVDSPVWRPDPESQEARGGHMFRRPKPTPTSTPRWRTSTSSRPSPPRRTTCSPTSPGTASARSTAAGRGSSTPRLRPPGGPPPPRLR